jgi:hypothetical protein
MKNRYFLIGYEIEGENGYQLIDHLKENTLRQAINKFKKRNDFEKLLEGRELVITKLEEVYR